MRNIDEQAQAIAEALSPSKAAQAAKWRWGTVRTVNSDGTMNVVVGGTELPSIRAAQHAMGAKVGDRVRVAYLGTDAMVDAVRATAKLMSLPTIDGAITATGRITGAGLTSNGIAQLNNAKADLTSGNIDVDDPSGSNLGSARIDFFDKDGDYFGTLAPFFENGQIKLGFQARRTVNGSNYYAGIRLGLDASGNATVGLIGTGISASFRNALGFSNTFTNTVSQVISAASGFTISQAQFVQNGRMGQWYMTVKNTKAMSANTQHTIGTIVSGKRPATWAPVSFGDTSNAYGNGSAVAGGSVIVRPSANIAAGTTFFLLCSAYILA